MALYHSLQKGRNIAARLQDGIVISADTFVAYDNRILGKPHDEKTAKQYLTTISGQSIEVITGYAIIDVKKKELQGHEITKIQMDVLTEKTIESYIKTGEPLDKAGAFGIQSKGATLVKNIDGCFFNVVGLPLYRIGKDLKKLGISIFNY